MAPPIQLIAIDPGGVTKGCSAARFSKGELVAVEPCLRLEELESFARTALYSGLIDPTIVVIERPQQDGRSRAVPPKVLIDLAWQGALLAGGLAVLGARIEELRPDEWKGQIHKALHHARILESGALTAEELNRIFGGAPIHREVFEARKKAALSRWGVAGYAKDSRTPDVFDAIALGLFYLGRITKEGFKT